MTDWEYIAGQMWHFIIDNCEHGQLCLAPDGSQNCQCGLDDVLALMPSEPDEDDLRDDSDVEAGRDPFNITDH